MKMRRTSRKKEDSRIPKRALAYRPTSHKRPRKFEKEEVPRVNPLKANDDNDLRNTVPVCLVFSVATCDDRCVESWRLSNYVEIGVRDVRQDSGYDARGQLHDISQQAHPQQCRTVPRGVLFRFMSLTPWLSASVVSG